MHVLLSIQLMQQLVNVKCDTVTRVTWL